MTSQQLAATQQTIQTILDLMQVQATINMEVDQSNLLKIQIDGEELGSVIGYHGETLNALQTIVGLIVNKDKADTDQDRYKVIVNVGDYRQRQKESLEALAKRSAERVRFSRKPLTLSPMSSYDRRIVHLALEHESDIVSVSEGEGRSRRLVVKPKD